MTGHAVGGTLLKIHPTSGRSLRKPVRILIGEPSRAARPGAVDLNLVEAFEIVFTTAPTGSAHQPSATTPSTPDPPNSSPASDRTPEARTGHPLGHDRALSNPDTIVRAITVIMGAVVGLTFLFGFGNVLNLGWGADPNWGAGWRVRGNVQLVV